MKDLKRLESNRIYYMIASYGFGVCAAGLVECLWDYFLPAYSPHSSFGAKVMVHIIILSTALAAGITTVLHRYWTFKDLPLEMHCSKFGFISAYAIFVFMLCILSRFIILIWPGLVVDFLIVSIPGLLGKYLCRKI